MHSEAPRGRDDVRAVGDDDSEESDVDFLSHVMGSVSGEGSGAGGGPSPSAPEDSSALDVGGIVFNDSDAI